VRRCVALSLLVLVGACGKAAPSATATATPVPPNCVFVGHLPTLIALQSGRFMQSDLDRVANEAPAEVRSDLKLGYEAGIRFWNEIRASRSLPAAERTRRENRAAAELAKTQYKQALGRVGAYTGSHCAGSVPGRS
jgi:hypothetical protein